MILSFTYKIGWKSSSNLWGCVKWFECYEATQGLNIQLAASHFETKQMATRAVIHTHLYQRDLRISCLPRIIRKKIMKKSWIHQQPVPLFELKTSFSKDPQIPRVTLTCNSPFKQIHQKTSIGKWVHLPQKNIQKILLKPFCHLVSPNHPVVRPWQNVEQNNHADDWGSLQFFKCDFFDGA